MYILFVYLLGFLSNIYLRCLYFSILYAENLFSLFVGIGLDRGFFYVRIEAVSRYPIRGCVVLVIQQFNMMEQKMSAKKNKMECREVVRIESRSFNLEEIRRLERSRRAEGFEVDYEYDVEEKCYIVRETLSLKPIIY